MAGALLPIEIDDAALRQEIAGMIGQLRSPGRAMRDIGDYMLRATDERFRAEHSPDGTPCAPNSDVF